MFLACGLLLTVVILLPVVAGVLLKSDGSVFSNGLDVVMSATSGVPVCDSSSTVEVPGLPDVAESCTVAVVLSEVIMA